MMKFTTWWRRRGVMVLGYLAAAIPSLLTIEGLIPDPQRKYWTAAGVLLGLAIAQLGHTISKQETRP